MEMGRSPFERVVVPVRALERQTRRVATYQSRVHVRTTRRARHQHREVHSEVVSYPDWENVVATRAV